tara:strand:+ start:217 stop:462 length:246 start_codon:yes stop_codon:yes gene_type:complete
LASSLSIQPTTEHTREGKHSGLPISGSTAHRILHVNALPVSKARTPKGTALFQQFALMDIFLKSHEAGENKKFPFTGAAPR